MTFQKGVKAVVHELKIWPEFFEGVVSGKKTFEIRRADRDFRVKDQLHLREWDPDKRDYTGRNCTVLVTCVLGDDWPGISKGHVLMGITRFIAQPAQSAGAIIDIIKAEANYERENNRHFAALALDRVASKLLAAV